MKTSLEVAASIMFEAGEKAMPFALEVVRHVSRLQVEAVTKQLLSGQGTDKTLPIIAAVARYYGVSYSEMRRRQSYRRIAKARNMCWALLRYRLDLTWSDIGDRFDRDHGTIIHGSRGADRKSADWAELNRVLDEQQFAGIAEAAE